MKIAGRDMQPLDLVFIIWGGFSFCFCIWMDLPDNKELVITMQPFYDFTSGKGFIIPYGLIKIGGLLMLLYPFIGPWWEKGNMVKEPDDDVKLAGWDRDSISEYWAKISFGKKALLAITILLIGGAINNWVDVINISNGMRIFLVILITSLTIWYFIRRK